jgi:hypothetical protein
MMFIDVIKRQMNIDSVDAVFHKIHYIHMTKHVPKYILRPTNFVTPLNNSKMPVH